MGRTGVVEQRTNDKMAIQCVARASLAIAGQEAAKESPAILPRVNLDHNGLPDARYAMSVGSDRKVSRRSPQMDVRYCVVSDLSGLAAPTRSLN
jgi:hypothetical protein